MTLGFTVVIVSGRRPHIMRFTRIALVLCVCLYVASADVAHLRAAKARLAARLASKAKHHKRGILTHVPPFKLGHDIPVVTHSVVKPLVVTYPPTAAVSAVKVPLAHPLIHRYPVPVGHKVPVPHPHYGLKFPHQTKTVLVPKPDHHFHHHHHHLEPKPAIPVVPAAPVPATPLVPVGQPTGTIATPIPAPPPPVTIHPAPVLPAQPLPVFPPPPAVLPPSHINFRPFLSASTIPLHSAPVPLQPAPVPIPPSPILPAPVYPLAHQYPYVIRPGNAVQTSYFATYPRYPLVNYHSPLVPLAAPIAPASVGQVLYERPEVPSFHLVPQPAAGHGVLEQPAPNVHVDPTPTFLHPTQVAHPTVHLQPTQPTVHLQPTQPTLHLQPTQPAVTLDNGWSPVPSQPHDLVPTSHPDVHFSQPHETPQFTQQQGTQVYEHHTGDEQQYHDYQQHLQNHIQEQIEQSQYEQHLNNQHQLGQEYGVPQQLGQEYGQPNQDFSQHAQDYAQHAQEYAQHGQQEYAQHGQEYAQHGQEYAQHGQEYAQHGQEYAQHGQEYAQHGQEYAHQDQEYNLHQQPGQEYGVPQPEGRSSDAEDDAQRYHNHIPLGLQPPIDRPLEHFR